jgi:UDP:flavonoid glycosyltransferase YjiC (YdhE family)
MSNFILLTQGTGGDLYPFIQISNQLKARGHKVTLIADPQFEEVVERYGINFVSLYIPSQVEKLGVSISKEKMSETRAFNRAEMFRHFQMVIKICSYIHARCNHKETVLIGHENLSIVSQTIAEILKLPYGVIFPSPYFVMRLPMYGEAFSIDANIINQYRDQLNLPPVNDWISWLKTAKWKIGLWPEWFASNETAWIFELSLVGFIWNQEFETGEMPKDVEEFLDDGEPPVLITHGTSEPLKGGFFSASIEACKITGRRVIVVSPYDKALPPYLPNSVKRYKYLPFASLLPRLGTIVHHGGIGTVNQSLIAGIPQLILAHGFDRPDNGYRVKCLGIGECLPPNSWRPDMVAAALRRLMTFEVQERCREISLRPVNVTESVAAVCEIIDPTQI